MWWIIALGIILAIIIYLLFAPFFVEIDSTIGLYRVRFHRMASARFIFDESTVFLKIKLAWWSKEYNLLELTKKEKHKKDEILVKGRKQKQKNKKQISFSKIRRKIKGILKSFYIEKCYITIDTESMPLNGILYPWFFLLSNRINKTIMINFWEENTVILKVKNSLGRILWAFIKS